MNNRSILLTHAERKLPFVLINTLLLHIPLLALTDIQNHGQRNELILVKLGNVRFLQVNIVVPAPITTAPHKIFIMSDEEGEHRRRTAACRHCADDTLPPTHCRRRQCCAAAKLPPLPPSLTFYVSLLSLFPLPLPLPLLVDC